MSFPSTWKWFWKCQSCLLYSVITCLLFDLIISPSSGKALGEAKHLSKARPLMKNTVCERKVLSVNTKSLSAVCLVFICWAYLCLWHKSHTRIDSLQCKTSLLQIIGLIITLLPQCLNMLCTMQFHAGMWNMDPRIHLNAFLRNQQPLPVPFVFSLSFSRFIYFPGQKCNLFQFFPTATPDMSCDCSEHYCCSECSEVERSLAPHGLPCC